jgi:hypothetical protein
MQCHIGFLMMCRRESKERERGRCLAKQPPLSFYVHKLRNYIDLPDDLLDNSLCMLSVESTQNYV